LGEIRILPEEVSSKIAAGEVIEGPFSIVRELIDNSLDAESDQLKITVNNGGKDYIQVTDNGLGMSEADALLSVQKHTTSKISDIEDLDTIATMGFRGEALSSICTVSAFTMLTKMEGGNTGTKLTCHFGKDLSTEPSASNTGTQIIVKNLFQNMPARRKFLKSNRAESAKIKDEVLKKALGFSERGFVYKVDDRIVLNLKPGKNISDRVEDIFGKDLNDNLSDVYHEDDRFSIRAFISNQKHTLSNRNGQYVFVNRRPVFDRALLYTLNSPAKGIVQAGRYIYAFVFIEIDPSLIDINIHPAKKEIKIKTAEKIRSVLYSTVEKLLRASYYPARFGREETYKAPPEYGDGQRVFSGDTDHFINPVLNGNEIDDISGGDVLGPGPGLIDNEKLVPGSDNMIPDLDNLFIFRGAVFNTYIVFEAKDFLFIVDQHAAHERVLYEKFKREAKNLDAVKNLLIPINFTPPRPKYSDYLDSIDAFRSAGLELEPFGDESFNITTIPAFVPEKGEEETISYILDEFNNGKMTPDAREIKERFIKLVSCKNAIKEGDVIKEPEARALLGELNKTQIPAVCPHGRPTFIRVSKENVEKVFKRR
jgi:DNA mismatch repair protein MutL